MSIVIEGNTYRARKYFKLKSEAKRYAKNLKKSSTSVRIKKIKDEYAVVSIP